MRYSFSDIRLSRKLLITPAVTVAMLLLVGGVTLLGLKRQSDTFGVLYGQFQNLGSGTLIIKGIERAHLNLYKALSWYSTGYEQQRIDSLTVVIFRDIDMVSGLIDTVLTGTGIGMTDAENYRLLKDTLVTYRKKMVQIVEMATVDVSLATTLISPIEMLMNTMQRQFGAIWAEGVASGKQANIRMRERFIGIMWFVIVALVVSILTAVMISSVIIHRIGVVVQKIIRSLSALSRGDLTCTTGLSGKDELGTIATAADGVVQSLRTLITDLVAGVESVTGSSGRLSATATVLTGNSHDMKTVSVKASDDAEAVTKSVGAISESAEKMSSGVHTVSTAIEEMSISLNEVAKNCQKESQATLQAQEHAAGTCDQMQQLAVSAKTVGKVLDIINDIADRINLLALNATIEAASAGDAGRGFAVVASEVKDLARQTAEALKQIEQQIVAMQAGTKRAELATEKIVGSINEVNDISQMIVAAVEEQSATINEIARTMTGASSEASEIAFNVAGSTDTLRRMAQSTVKVQQGTEKTGGSVEEIIAVAASLNGVAVELKISIDKFKL